MTWFKVDDTFWSHPKVLPLPNSAVGLWLRAGCWAASHLTDGHVPLHALKMLGTSTDRGRLIESGLWIERDDGSIQFHDWEHYQPTRAQVEQKRMADRKRQQDWRDRLSQRDKQRESQRQSRRESRNPRPDPSRRDPPTPQPPNVREVLADLEKRIEDDD